MIATEYLQERVLPSGITYHGIPRKESGVRIIFIHGMWGNAKMFLPLLETLEDCGIEVFAINLPFHGASVNKRCHRGGRDLGNSSLDEYVNDVLQATMEIQDLFGTKDFVFAGHSMGGRIAQEAGVRILVTWMVHQLKGICLLASAPPQGIILTGPVVLKIPLYFKQMLRGSFALSEKDHKNLMQNEGLEVSWRSQYDIPAQKESGKAALDIVKGQYKFDWLFADPKPTIFGNLPMLILAGSKDRMISPGVSRSIMRRYPKAQKEWFDGDHYFPFATENTVEVSRIMVEWIGMINPAYIEQVAVGGGAVD